ncbi:uncharacterized protein PV07_01771 [Cladophialophora immunda]|uniref:Beta-lactamase-related domain-containing protein n=1 Tax=Cladophialophora immunda TaxID=569365 RepID=A0A0D2CYR9_9EURO|nr:uncharacterized protein PV07_01771 [Cladophialophora immunda]KIW35045.1 hypothetical protein PV07_01771 [Cladophialophora immunda]
MPTDITNWREAGHNIWGFQNVDKIVPTDPISKGSEISSLKSKPCNFEDFRLNVPKDMPMDLPSFLSQTETDGLVVLKDGFVVFEHYGRSNTKSSVHATFSLSKSFLGLLCGVLVEQGKLATTNLVSSYIPEVKGSAYETVTVRQLLDMRSGVNHNDASPRYRSATGLYPLEPHEQPTDLHTYIPTIQSSRSAAVDGLDGPPFEYISANADLMGWVIERASGQKFAKVLSETIWQRMGAESDAYVTVDRSGNARAAAGICATVRDIARLGQVILRSGTGIVPETWIQDILHGGSEAAFAAGSEKGEYDRFFDNVAYRSYWIVDRSSQVLMASGTNGQLLLVDCKNDIVMAKTSSQPKRTDWGKIHLTVQAFKEFRRLIDGQDLRV